MIFQGDDGDVIKSKNVGQKIFNFDSLIKFICWFKKFRDLKKLKNLLITKIKLVQATN